MRFRPVASRGMASHDFRRYINGFVRVAAAALFTGATAHGAETGERATSGTEEVRLRPYIVVATRTPLNPDRVSPSVTYIGEAALEDRHYRDVTDALFDQPGLNLAWFGTKGSATSLFIRGTESNHTSLFLDGRRLNPAFGNQFNLEHLSVGNLGSVQLKRGPSSVQYGSSGIGGVIDLRTRSAPAEEGVQGTVEAEAGSNEFRRGAVAARGKSGALGFSLGAGAGSAENERPNDAYERASARARFDYALSERWGLEFVGQYVDAEKELPGSVVSPTAEDRQETTNWLASPGLRYATDELSAHLFYARSRSRTDVFDAGGFSNRLEVESDEVRLQVDLSAAENLLLTSGAVYREDRAFNSDISFFGPPESFAQTFEQTGVYGKAVWRASDRIEVRGGVRHDSYSEFDDQTTGSLEGILKFPEHALTLFAKAGTAYAPPSASDIAFDSEAGGTPLQPEESVSYELGVRKNLFGERLRLSAVVFRNDIDELLDFRTLPGFVFDTFNVKEARTEGVETSAEWDVNDRLTLNAAYTYLSAEDLDEDERLLRRPRHTVQAGASYAFADTLSGTIRAVGYFDRRDTDPATFAAFDAGDYVVVRGSAEWVLNAEWTVFARVENLFDREYAPIAGYPALGRSGYLGARFSF